MTDPLEMLTNEHRQAEQLMGRLEDADGDEQRQLCEQLAEMLTMHMDLEEEHVYPMVQRLVGDEEAEEANTEHRLAREGVANLTELVGEPGFGDALEMLKAGIKHHVEEEENEVFPELRDKVDEGELDELGTILERAHGADADRDDDLDDDERQLDSPQLDLDAADDRNEARRATSGNGSGSGDNEPSKQELYERAKEMGIKGRSSMTKQELARAVQRQDG
jgi:hemerythrin-like domain-containing protein